MTFKGYAPTLDNNDISLPAPPGAYAARVNDEVSGLFARAWFARATVVDVLGLSNTNDDMTYEAGDSVDGVTLAQGDIILRTASTDTHRNGLYVVPSSGVAPRHAAFASYDHIAGVYVAVAKGTTYADTLWKCTSDPGGTIDLTALAFSQSSASIAPWEVSGSALRPVTDGVGSLGDSSHRITGIDLASAAVIRWANADTLTHNSDALTLLGISTITGKFDGGTCGTVFEGYHDTANVSGASTNYRRSRGTIASPTALQSGDRIANFSFQGQMSTTPGDFATPCSIICSADENFSSTNRGASFSLEATAVGASSRVQQMKVAGGAIYFPGAGTTALAANAFLDSGSSPANQILRSTSSLRFKRDMEAMHPARAVAIVEGARAIWYRSKCEHDRRDWSWDGFAAEEMAKIDPRYVHWGYRDEDYDTIVHVDEQIERRPVMEPIDQPYYDYVKTQGGLKRVLVTERPQKMLMPVWDEDGNGIDAVEVCAFEEHVANRQERVERKLKPGAQLVPDGVAYDRLVVPLLICVRDLRERVAVLEARLKSCG